MTWQEFEPMLRERLTRLIDSDPEVLLEHDGGPFGLKAHLYLATLYGIDGQVDAEWRIPAVTSTLLRPLMRRSSYAIPESEPGPGIATARYELQSSWATLNLDWMLHRNLLPDDVRPDPGTFLVTVALLRYRHRL